MLTEVWQPIGGVGNTSMFKQLQSCQMYTVALRRQPRTELAHVIVVEGIQWVGWLRGCEGGGRNGCGATEGGVVTGGGAWVVPFAFCSTTEVRVCPNVDLCKEVLMLTAAARSRSHLAHHTAVGDIGGAG